jgi:RNA polymerase sigma-70 factor (ECF subfamily)
MELAIWMSRLDPEGAERETELAVLLERALAGDAAAFEQIVRRHERRVLTLAWRLLGSMADAQDAAQEVFIRTFRFLHRFDVKRPLEPWLVRLTVNVCRDLGRKKGKRREVFSEVDGFLTEFPSLMSAGDPHTELAAQQQRDMLHAALATLPEKERAAIVLRDLEGLSTAEVAQALGSSEATVRAQISSARVKIKKTIQRKKGGRP